jgi:hypothetical protein
MQQNPTSPEIGVVLEAVDRRFPGPAVRRIVLDAAAQTVAFEQCHWPRRFWSWQFDACHICNFGEIRAAHDIGQGELRSVMINTATGRCRMFADWHGYEAMRTALQQIASAAPPVHWMAHPRMIPVYAALFVVLLTWMLFLLT